MATGTTAEQIIDVVTPAAGESVSEGTILEWRVKVGGFIKATDTIVEISTDKVDVELPAPASGTVTEILVEEGDTVTVGQVIARIGAGGGPAAGEAPAAGDGDGAVATRPIEGETELLRGSAAALARYMEQSRAIPTATSFRTLTGGVVDARRQQVKAAGQRVSFTHLIAYAIARAAQEMPVMADHCAEVDGKPHRVRDGQVNLGLAVDVEKRDGSRTLMVPVIYEAGRMPFAAFVSAYDALVEKARTNTLGADDLVGANISLTNPGGLGTAASVPRLMQGQGTIIATGSIGYPPGLARAGASLGPDKVMAQIPARILRVYVPGTTLADALPHLRETYCGTIAYEIEHIASHRQRVWLREHIESGAFRQPLTTEERKTLLKRLVEIDALERFMHKAYLGQHQFSIEGLDMTVPMLDELIQLSAAHGGKEVVIGMAHRGRLNVLTHNLGRTYDTIFAEFEGASTLEAVTTIPQGGTGDVKYHHGTHGSYQLPDGGSIRVNLESNPSHLEYVYPVVEGATRAAQTAYQGPHVQHDTDAAVPIAIHGDASFPAQGVVSETLNLQALDGYKVGGTIHLITNNQIGFTTDPDEARSTRWASDLAKGFDVPILHVNADDVEACVSAVRLAFAFREQFGHDVLIDLIGYRRFGHNEADEPAYTQPEMYQAIKKHPPARELYARQLIDRGVVSEQESTEMTDSVWGVLTEEHHKLKAQIEHAKEVEHATGEYQLDRTASPEVKTAVAADRLQVL